MSYAISQALQAAVYGALGGISAPVFDALPAGPLPELYVTLGPETVRDRSGAGAKVARHDFTVSVISDASGFRAAKAVAGEISDVLSDADLTLERGTLVALDFLRARARRTSQEGVRRIDLTFRAIVDDDA